MTESVPAAVTAPVAAWRLPRVVCAPQSLDLRRESFSSVLYSYSQLAAVWLTSSVASVPADRYQCLVWSKGILLICGCYTACWKDALIQ